MGIKESIGWATKTWNPVTGCWGPGGTEQQPNRCPYCYAQRLAKRLRGRFGYPLDDPFAPAFHPERLDQPGRWKAGKRVFVCSMGDLFAPWIRDAVVNTVLQAAIRHEQHVYFFLTKYAERYGTINSTNGNMFFGVTVENQHCASKRIPLLLDGCKGGRFVSIEPMLGPVNLERIITYKNGIYTSWLDALKGKVYHPVCRPGRNGPSGLIATDKPKLSWVILGAQTGPGAKSNAPKQQWIDAVVEQTRTSGVPLFMKQNLAPYWKGELIQEWPEPC